MLVKEFKDFTQIQLRQLGAYASMTIEDFIREIESKGKVPNKFYKNLYDEIMSQILEGSNLCASESLETTKKVELTPTEQILEKIPLGFIQYYIEEKDYKKSYNAILGVVKNFYQLSTYEHHGNTKLKYIRTANEWKSFVNSNSGKIIEDWNDVTSKHIIPSSYDESLGFTENIRNAFIEYGDLLKTRSKNKRYFTGDKAKKAYRDGEILLLYYRDKLTRGEIEERIGLQYSRKSEERIRQILQKAWNGLMSGEPVMSNVVLHHTLIDTARSIKSECLFCSIEKYKSWAGDTNSDFLAQFGVDLVDVGKGQFLVPVGTMGTYKKVYKVIQKTLLETLLPDNAENLLQSILENEELDCVMFEQKFVERILSYGKFVDWIDSDTIQIKDEYLANAQQRYVRIIYNSENELTTEQAKERYEQIYKISPAAGPKTEPKYSIFTDQNKWYYGAPRKYINDSISDFIEKHIIFYISELEIYLKEQGYSIPQYKSFRTKITRFCSPDVHDENHFCHKDYTENYPEYTWRNPTQYGQTNWILNCVKEILDDKWFEEIDTVLAQLKEKAIGSDFEEIVNKRAKYILPSYCGDTQPFYFDGKKISKNEPYYSQCDFSTIGLRGGKYSFYTQIRSIAFNEVKKSDNGRKELTEIIDVINEIVDEEISRNVVIRAIEDVEKRFPSIDLELISDNGRLFVVWTGHAINPEPTFEVSNGVDESEEQIHEVENTETKPAIKFRQDIDWIELGRIMKQELSFYKYWMIREEYELDSSIDDFLDFIRHSENSNLNRRLPQNLYEYWFASTDSYDRSTYLTNLALFFEALLSDIYYQQHGVRLRKKGLSDWAEEFVGLPQKLLFSRDSKGFDRIASDLHYKRNKIAHGDDIKLSSLETAKTITDYAALYVYVFARYHKA